MKRILAALIAAVIVESFAAGPAAAEPASAEEFKISADSAVVIDASSHRILFAKNAKKQRGMASTTKIMTAIAALENGDLSGLAKVSAQAASVEGSSMYLDEGEEVSLENLLWGLMLVSGNDAASAIAEHVGGTVDKFAAIMNDTAKKIGCVNTRFTNPHGLDNPEHYTTAFDLALISAYGLDMPKFREIAASKSKKVTFGGRDVYLTNHNKMLNMYPNCIGVKTGYTRATGRCLVTAAERNGMRLICVTLDAPNDWADHRAMLDRCFAAYTNKVVAQKGQQFGEAFVEEGERGAVKAVAARDFTVPLLEWEEARITLTPHVDQSVDAPIKAGDKVGFVSVALSGEENITYPLAAAESVRNKNLRVESTRTLFDALALIFENWIYLTK